MSASEMMNGELADWVRRIGTAKNVCLLDEYRGYLEEAATRLKAYGHWCPDKECACHHDGHHDRLEPCTCGAPARIYRTPSGDYYAGCTKCDKVGGNPEVTEYWAALFWNEMIRKERDEGSVH